MNKQQFMKQLVVEQDGLLKLIGDIASPELSTRIVYGNYTIKDIIAHLMAYQAGLVIWLQEARVGKVYIDPVLDDPDLDARNRTIYEKYKHLEIPDLLVNLNVIMSDLLDCIEELSEQELTDPELTAWFVKPRWGNPQPVWECIANDSYEHYRQHIPDIEQYLSMTDKSSILAGNEE